MNIQIIKSSSGDQIAVCFPFNAKVKKRIRSMGGEWDGVINRLLKKTSIFPLVPLGNGI